MSKARYYPKFGKQTSTFGVNPKNWMKGIWLKIM